MYPFAGGFAPTSTEKAGAEMKEKTEVLRNFDRREGVGDNINRSHTQMS